MLNAPRTALRIGRDFQSKLRSEVRQATFFSALRHSGRSRRVASSIALIHEPTGMADGADDGRQPAAAPGATSDAVTHADLAQLDGHSARCVGSMLSSMIGDVLGKADEGKPWQAVAKAHADTGGLAGWEGVGRYTDDTQMSLALAQSLVEKGGCDMEHCSLAYADAFDHRRGYGKMAARALTAIKSGADPTTTGTASNPAGSFANGGAMRIAPLGLAYRNAEPAALRKAVQDALLCTHVHPDGVAGALVQAAAVAALSLSTPAGDASAGEGPAATPASLLQGLALRVEKGSLMHSKLMDLKEGFFQIDQGAHPQPHGGSNWEGDAGAAAWQADLQLLGGVANMKNQIHACEAVACSLWALLRHWHHPQSASQLQAAITAAARYGGDTDTLAAMTGAMAGALHGPAWVPADWWERLENGPGGRDDIVQAAVRLAELDVKG